MYVLFNVCVIQFPGDQLSCILVKTAVKNDLQYYDTVCRMWLPNGNEKCSISCALFCGVNQNVEVNFRKVPVFPDLWLSLPSDSLVLSCHKRVRRCQSLFLLTQFFFFNLDAP